MANLLVVDDEKNIRAGLAKFLESSGHQVESVDSGARALALLAGKRDFDLVLTDYQMAEMNGLELLKHIKQHHPNTLVILMTAYGTIQNAVSSIKAGAYDYVTKPFSLQEIQHLLDRALEVKKLRTEVRELRGAIGGAPVLDTRSDLMVELFETARQAAASDATILLSGESGTGKNVIARQIHEWSLRRERPFVVVNCTTLSEHLLESELFGHMRGAFTGAVKDKPGRVEAADGGTVFLDEVADLAPPLQTKFLRFLQEQRFERLGGQQTIAVDTRIIAASNRDLQTEVSAGRFRADLFYRLNVMSLRLPALHERRGDILPLARRALKACARGANAPLVLSREAEQSLLRYDWPGNARELNNIVQRAAWLASGGEITAAALDIGGEQGCGNADRTGQIAMPDRADHAARAQQRDAGLDHDLKERERELILATLRVTAGSRKLAAERLGISPRTLRHKLQQLKASGVSVPGSHEQQLLSA